MGPRGRCTKSTPTRPKGCTLAPAAKAHAPPLQPYGEQQWLAAARASPNRKQRQAAVIRAPAELSQSRRKASSGRGCAGAAGSSQRCCERGGAAAGTLATACTIAGAARALRQNCQRIVAAGRRGCLPRGPLDQQQTTGAAAAAAKGGGAGGAAAAGATAASRDYPSGRHEWAYTARSGSAARSISGCDTKLQAALVYATDTATASVAASNRAAAVRIATSGGCRVATIHASSFRGSSGRCTSVRSGHCIRGPILGTGNGVGTRSCDAAGESKDRGAAGAKDGAQARHNSLSRLAPAATAIGRAAISPIDPRPATVTASTAIVIDPATAAATATPAVTAAVSNPATATATASPNVLAAGAGAAAGAAAAAPATSRQERGMLRWRYNLKGGCPI